MKDIFTVPNFVCLFRVLLCFWSFYYFIDSGNKVIFSILVLVIILLDGLDGILARRLNQATALGAKVDIISDRIVELSFWLFFAFMGFLGYWVFVYFLIRGFAVDFISFKTDKPLGKSWLRSSREMRFISGLTKILSFILVPLFPESFLVQILVYITVLVNFLRAIPVFIR